jgi:hypothetical protein
MHDLNDIDSINSSDLVEAKHDAEAQAVETS